PDKGEGTDDPDSINLVSPEDNPESPEYRESQTLREKEREKVAPGPADSQGAAPDGTTSGPPGELEETKKDTVEEEAAAAARPALRSGASEKLQSTPDKKNAVQDARPDWAQPIFESISSYSEDDDPGPVGSAAHDAKEPLPAQATEENRRVSR
ncbi:unnamed protein product, partial [Symbiodinium sp. CCMP2592]